MKDQVKEALEPYKTIFKDCDFDNECDFCDKPNGGTYCRDMSGPENDDDYYWVCGACVLRIQMNHGGITGLRLAMQIDEEYDPYKGVGLPV